MSFAELKEQVAELPAAERFRLTAFLAELEEQDEPGFRKQADRRMKAMDKGEKVAMEDFEAKHTALKALGR